MTARQQIARLLPLVLLVALVIAGLRGVVTTPRWDGPLKAYGVAIGIALEVVFCALLLVVRSREAAARRAGKSGPYAATAEQDIEPPQALRFTLTSVLVACIVGIAVVLVADLHLHFFSKSGSLPPRTLKHGFLPLRKSRSGRSSTRCSSSRSWPRSWSASGGRRGCAARRRRWSSGT